MNKHHQHSQNTNISCQNCHFNKLCIPGILDSDNRFWFDSIVERKRNISKGTILFKASDPLKTLYAVHSGAIKKFILTKQGDEQVIAFHFPGDLIGFDGLYNQYHQSFAQSLQTSTICEISLELLHALFHKMPFLPTQLLKLMSHEIINNQKMLLLLSKKNAEQRLATLLCQLSYHANINSTITEFKLPMTRSDIASYLGLTIETISRLFHRFQESNILQVDGKTIVIKNMIVLNEIAENAS